MKKASRGSRKRKKALWRFEGIQSRIPVTHDYVAPKLTRMREGPASALDDFRAALGSPPELQAAREGLARIIARSESQRDEPLRNP